ncbi:MAG: 30S ribosomal protein S8 [Patescibacteria group bacterium]
MLTDPISDFLTRIRNASSARRHELTVRSSRMIKAIAQVLMDKHFLEKVEEVAIEKTKELHIVLRAEGEPLQLKRVSKPGQRIYVGWDKIKRVKNGQGIAIISTSRGILPGEEARKQKVGGEFLCEVY